MAMPPISRTSFSSEPFSVYSVLEFFGLLGLHKMEWFKSAELLKIVFAFYSPCGIFPLRNDFAPDGAVCSRLRTASAVTERDNLAFEVM